MGKKESSPSYQRQCAQLGMITGTAHQKLKKRLLFSFIQRLNLDTCYRCGTKIELIDELSVDHKIDWLDADPALFWDLNNIAFSHFKCNRPRMYREKRLMDIPNGFRRCNRCEQIKPLTDFYENKKKAKGRQHFCKPCQQAAKKLSRGKKNQNLAVEK